MVVFWRPHQPLFFILDDWTALLQMVVSPLWQYLITPNGEQWFPVFLLAYYGLIKAFGDQYNLLLLVNCLGTGLNAFLLFLFLQRQWRSLPAFALSFFYCLAAVQYATLWHGFYLCYILSLFFFLLALLLTDRYCSSSSWFTLWGIGLCAWLSVLSHNYTLLAIWALPLYLLMTGEKGWGRQFWLLTGTIALVFLSFAVGYFTFAGPTAAASHNHSVFSSLPGPMFFLHWWGGSFIAPFLYFFWGHNYFPLWAYFPGIILFLFTIGIIWRRGEPEEKKFALWALALNAIPFFLISLTRYQRSFYQAFVPRYGIFTLLGALILLGISWQILVRRRPRQAKVIPWVILTVMIGGQVGSYPRWQEKYLRLSRGSLDFYSQLKEQASGVPSNPEEIIKGSWLEERQNLTRSQAEAIRQFLLGKQPLNFPKGEHDSSPQ